MGDAIERLYNPASAPPLHQSFLFGAARGAAGSVCGLCVSHSGGPYAIMHIEGMKTRGGFLEKIRAIFGHAA